MHPPEGHPTIGAGFAGRREFVRFVGRGDVLQVTGEAAVTSRSPPSKFDLGSGRVTR